MKKSITLLLVVTLILALFAFVGCGHDREDAAAGVDLTVSVVVSTQFGDKSFNDSAKVGGEALEEYYGVKVKYKECNGSEYEQAMMDAAKVSDFVVPVGWEFWRVADIALEYPDTKFIWVDNVVDGVENYPNLLCVTYAQNEGSFLTGYIAAKTSKSGTIGVVAGDESLTIKDFIAGYKQGAKLANEKVKVLVDYADSFEDIEAGKVCARRLYSKGADVIFQIAGRAGNGVFQIAKEKGFYAIGVDQDQKLTASEYQDVILCSMIKNVGKSIYETIKAYIKEETWEGGRVWNTDMSSEYISIAYGNKNSTQLISDELKAEVEQLKKKVVSGEIVVDSAMK